MLVLLTRCFLRLTRQRHRLAAALVGVCLLALGPTAAAVSLLFQENFEGLPLGPPVDEDFPPADVFTHDPPSGWELINNVPGENNPFVGVEEWEGWSFAKKGFWTAVANPAGAAGAFGREEFSLGIGTIAVADPDQWNDLGDPANEIGFYNTLLQTPQIPLDQAPRTDDRLVLQFDSSWRGGCCDDGGSFNPQGNNQTAVLFARLDGGPRFELFRWESAEFFDQQGRPSKEPLDPSGLPNTPNPFFRADNTNERVQIDLSVLLPSAIALLSESGAPFARSSHGGGNLSFEFGMENAGDDGWWAVDNVELASYETLKGDMDLSGVLDEPDIEAFALGLLDSDAYRFAHYGASPVDHGSLDDRFNFDDIPWFTDLMEGAGVASASEALALLFAPSVPEPSSGLLAMAAGAVLLSRRGRA